MKYLLYDGHGSVRQLTANGTGWYNQLTKGVWISGLLMLSAHLTIPMAETGSSKPRNVKMYCQGQAKGLVGWLNFGSWKVKLAKRLCCVAVVLIGTAIISNSCGFLMVMFPRLCGALILFLLAVPCVTMLLTPLLLLIQWLAGSSVSMKVCAGLWRSAFLSGCLLAIAGAGLFSFGSSNVAKVSTDVRQYLRSTEFPLGDLGGIAVDGRGRIYLGLQAYSRVQLYNAEGHFIRGFFVPTNGAFDIWVDDRDCLHAVLSRARLHQVFDSTGSVLYSESIVSAEDAVRLSRNAPGKKQEDSFGSTYVIEDVAWFPKVVRTAPDGRKRVLIQDALHSFLVRSPKPVLDLAFVGFLIAIISCAAGKICVSPAQHRKATSIASE